MTIVPRAEESGRDSELVHSAFESVGLIDLDDFSDGGVDKGGSRLARGKQVDGA
jgi:hypothetical protein